MGAIYAESLFIDSGARDIPGFDGFYRINKDGQVWTCRTQGPTGERKVNWKPKKSFLFDGYPSIVLTKKGKVKTYRIHSLILITFVGPRPAGYEARHLDGTRWNSVLSNLKWGTKSRNQLDRRGTKVDQRGENGNNAKLVPAQVKRIRELYSTGKWFYRELGDKFGVELSTIADIIRRTTWSA